MVFFVKNINSKSIGHVINRIRQMYSAQNQYF